MNSEPSTTTMLASSGPIRWIGSIIMDASGTVAASDVTLPPPPAPAAPVESPSSTDRLHEKQAAAPKPRINAPRKVSPTIYQSTIDEAGLAASRLGGKEPFPGLGQAPSPRTPRDDERRRPT